MVNINTVNKFEDEDDDLDLDDDDLDDDGDPYYYRFVKVAPDYRINTHDLLPSVETGVMPSQIES